MTLSVGREKDAELPLANTGVSEMDELKKLREALAEAEPGPVDVERVLADAWHLLSGGFDGGMEPRKLLRRTFSMEWEPPVLRFKIERHGAIVAGGSGYAEIQSWAVDVDEESARITGTKRRRVRPMQPALDTDALAAELAEKIVSRSEDDRLRWSSRTGRVQIRMAEALPRAVKRTTEGRRKRLNAALKELLEPQGWTRVGAWWGEEEDDAS